MQSFPYDTPLFLVILPPPWTTRKTEKRKYAFSWEMKSVSGQLKYNKKLLFVQNTLQARYTYDYVPVDPIPVLRTMPRTRCAPHYFLVYNNHSHTSFFFAYWLLCSVLFLWVFSLFTNFRVFVKIKFRSDECWAVKQTLHAVCLRTYASCGRWIVESRPRSGSHFSTGESRRRSSSSCTRPQCGRQAYMSHSLRAPTTAFGLCSAMVGRFLADLLAWAPESEKESHAVSLPSTFQVEQGVRAWRRGMLISWGYCCGRTGCSV